MVRATLAAVLLLPVSAFAGHQASHPVTVTQPAPPTTATASAASHSHASARVTNNVTVSTTSPSSHMAGGAANTRGGSDAGGNTPDVLGPAISGGNPCAVGGGIGGSGPGAGGLLTLLLESDRCSLRQDAALLYNMGYRGAAKNVACQNPWVAEAFAKTGDPCEADVQRWVRAGYRQRDDGWWERGP